MLYRAFVLGIVAFWLLMAALLVRTELFPEEASQTPVPVSYVVRLLFRHEQTSDLTLFSQRRRLDGNLHLQPHRLPAPAAGQSSNLLSASGNFLLSLPGSPSQRVIFRGVLEVDDQQTVQRVELSVSLHEPKQSAGGYNLRLEGQPQKSEWHYELRRGGNLVREGAGTPTDILETFDLSSFGIDPKAFDRLGQQAAVTMTARRGTLRMNNEDIDTYVVTLQQGGGLESTIHLNQLGQILAVKTFLGYDLYDEAVAP